jgi:hypothetical protein
MFGNVMEKKLENDLLMFFFKFIKRMKIKSDK